MEVGERQENGSSVCVLLLPLAIGNIGIGLLLTLKAFRVYVASVLMFVGQLEELPDNFKDSEARACRKLFPGPMDWITADGLRELKSLGFQDEMKDIVTTLIAAKARVVKFESGGDLNVRGRAEEMQRLTCSQDSTNLARLGWLSCWRNTSFLLNLNRARVRVGAIYMDNALDTHWAEQQLWQKRIANMIYGQPKGLALIHLRKRLDHWKLALSPGLRVNRALRMLQLVSDVCQPRVWAATLRLLCNGWCTSSRFGGRGRCRMQCGCDEDSIRHLAGCPVVRRLFAAHLGIQPPTHGHALDTFLGLDNSYNDREAVKQRVLANYALYRVFNSLRHGQISQENLDGAFDAYLREARCSNENLE